MFYKHFVPAVIIGWALGAAIAADAHPRLLATVPAANAMVSRADRVTMRFSERLIAPMSGGEITATAMRGHAMTRPLRVGSVTPSIAADGRTMVLVLRNSLPPGSYRVGWHAVAADTHRVQGTFGFRVN